MTSFILALAPEIYPDRAAQIPSLLTKKVKILDKYADFANVFLKKKALVLPDRTKLNKHTINLKNSKQLSYRPIYSLGPGKLETLKTYIKTHLKTRFIQPSKSLADAFIHLIKSQITASACVLIIKISTISQLKTGTPYP